MVKSAVIFVFVVTGHGHNGWATLGAFTTEIAATTYIEHVVEGGEKDPKLRFTELNAVRFELDKPKYDP